MLTRRWFAGALLVLVLVVFLGGLLHLVQLRYEHGDVYPPYSSFRTDPLGAKVLYLALDDLPGCEATRNLHPLSRLLPAAPASVYVLGVKSPSGDMEVLKKLAQTRSSRVVIALLARQHETPAPTPSEPPSRRPPHASPSATPEQHDGALLGFEVKTQKSTSTATTTLPELPPSIAWHSDAWFANLDKAWRVIYQCAGKPVMIERRFGSGSMVVASDSYLLSNEAMLNDRSAALLAWLNGPGTHIVFDETHLHVEEHEGIATLVRKYRLLGLLGAMAVFIALVMWQQASSLVPSWAERHESDEQILTGRDARAGFISLLRRSVSPRELIATCLTEWKRTCDRPLNPARQKEFDAAVAEAAARPLATYQSLHKILAEKSR